MNQEALSVREPNRNIMELFGQGNWRCTGKSFGIYKNKYFTPAAQFYSKPHEACGYWKGSQDISKMILHPLKSILKCQVSQKLTWPQFKCQKYVKGCRGCNQPGVEAGMQCLMISIFLCSAPPAASLTKKQSSSEVSAATPTYTLNGSCAQETWIM